MTAAAGCWPAGPVLGEAWGPGVRLWSAGQRPWAEGASSLQGATVRLEAGFALHQPQSCYLGTGVVPLQWPRRRWVPRALPSWDEHG